METVEQFAGDLNAAAPSDVVVASSKPSRVEMRHADGTVSMVTRVPLREVFELTDDF